MNVNRDLNKYRPNWDAGLFHPLKKLPCALPAPSHRVPTCNPPATMALFSISMLRLWLEKTVLEGTATVCILLLPAPFISLGVAPLRRSQVAVWTHCSFHFPAGRPVTRMHQSLLSPGALSKSFSSEQGLDEEARSQI